MPNLFRGAVAALLLLPIPAFAFTWATDWSVVGTPVNTSYSASGNVLNIQGPTTGDSLMSITLQRNVTVNGTERLAAAVTRLNAFTINNGNTNLGLGVSVNGTTFLTYSLSGSGSTGVNQFASQGSALAAGTYTVQVTFQITANNPKWTSASPSTPTAVFTFSSVTP